MKKYSQIFLILMTIFLFIKCERDFGPSTTNILKYEFTHGWTGKTSTIIISYDYTGFKNVDNTKIQIEFSNDEIKELKVILANYSSFIRFYQPENGAWFDIPTHELIYYGEIGSDSVSIYEPLDSPDIPVDLANLVELLMSKL